jgi:uncharacterized protein YegP (UPF0339 family)
MRKEHWEYRKNHKGEWQSRFIAANGEILFVSSEGYHNKEDMLHAIDVLEDAMYSMVFERPTERLERRLIEL